MADFATKTRTELRDQLADDIKNTLAGARVDGPGDDLFDIATAVGAALEESTAATAKASNESFPTTASFAGLKKHAKPFIGDPRDATPAQVVVSIAGDPGATWDTDDTLVATESGIRYAPLVAGTMPGGGTTTITVEAQVGGDNTVLTAGAQLMWETMPVGLSPLATATGAYSGGSDAETREEYLQRFLDSQSNPSSGGKLRDFEAWCLAVDGVGRATAFAARRGLGTVDVAILDGEGDAVSDDVLDDAQDAIDANRPACSLGSQAVRPTLIEVDLTCSLYLAAGYEFSTTPDASVGAGSTPLSVRVADTTGFSVDDWIAVRELRQARKIVAIDAVAGMLGVEAAFTTSRGVPAAPEVGDHVVPGCSTYDQLARSILDLFDDLNSGATYYRSKGVAALVANYEVLNAAQDSPAGDVEAQVDADLLEHLVLGDLILEAAV